MTDTTLRGAWLNPVPDGQYATSYQVGVGVNNRGGKWWLQSTEDIVAGDATGSFVVGFDGDYYAMGGYVYQVDVVVPGATVTAPGPHLMGWANPMVRSEPISFDAGSSGCAGYVDLYIGVAQIARFVLPTEPLPPPDPPPGDGGGGGGSGGGDTGGDIGQGVFHHFTFTGTAMKDLPAHLIAKSGAGA